MSSRTNTAAFINGRWVVKVQKNGVRKSFYSSLPGRKGQQEANAKADTWLDGEVVNTKCRVKDIWKDYLADVEARSSRSNYNQIRSIGDSYVLPVLGNKKVCDLTEGDLQSLVNRAYKHGTFNAKQSKRSSLKPGETLSRKTLNNIVATLKNFIKYCRIVAKATSLVPETLRVPAGARLDGKSIMQPENLKTLFASDMTTWRGKPVKDDMIYAYRLAVLTGLRPGELLGLRWGDFTPGDTHLRVRRSINVLNEETQGKNQNAVRSIPLTDYAKETIAEQRRFSADNHYGISAIDPVFRQMPEPTLLDNWKRYCRANGIPIVTLYELRHTFVSIASLLPAGEVKMLVGHSRSMDTFGTYGHHVQMYDQTVADDLSGLFETFIG